jgi:hypothetical protein
MSVACEISNKWAARCIYDSGLTGGLLKFEVELGTPRFGVLEDLCFAHQRVGNGFIINEISQATINFDALAHGKANGAVFDRFD